MHMLAQEVQSFRLSGCRDWRACMRGPGMACPGHSNIRLRTEPQNIELPEAKYDILLTRQRGY